MKVKTFKTQKGTELPLMNIKGKDYLQVAHRIVWFREVFPKGVIETYAVTVDEKSALFKARILDESNKLIAIAHKYENSQGFPDFIEKAETGAIGRALALCGFGTQFTGDDLYEGNRLADSPIQALTPNTTVSVKPEDPGEGNGNTGNDGEYISFGKYAKRRPSEIDHNELEEYYFSLESGILKKDKRIFKDEKSVAAAQTTLELIGNYLDDHEKGQA